MNSHFTEQPDSAQQRAKRPRLRSGRVIGGGIVLALFILVSALATGLVLHSSNQPARASGGAPTPTPTIGSPAPGQRLPHGSLYMTTPGSLTRVDLKTGKTLWSIQASYPLAPLVIGKTLYFENADSTNPFLEAANAQTGAQTWQDSNLGDGFLTGNKNMLYDSLCDSSSVCTLYGINASTGAQVWSYPLSGGSAWITLANGVVYVVSYTNYFALNATTGTLLWQKNLLNYTDQEANMTPVVRGNVLSFASCNTTKQSSGFPGCYLYAFNARTGQELWHMATTSKLWATPTIMNGVVYEGAIDDGTLFALNAQTGQQLWSVNTGDQIAQLISNAGTIYVGGMAPDGLSIQVEAFDAATHTPRWGQLGSTGLSSTTALAFTRRVARSTGLAATLPFKQQAPHSGGPAAHPFALADGFIYAPGTDTISVLDATNGTLLARYAVPGSPLSGFTVVG